MVNFLKKISFKALEVIIFSLFHKKLFSNPTKFFFQRARFYLKIGPEYQATKDFLTPELTGLTLW